MRLPTATGGRCVHRNSVVVAHVLAVHEEVLVGFLQQSTAVDTLKAVLVVGILRTSEHEVAESQWPGAAGALCDEDPKDNI